MAVNETLSAYSTLAANNTPAGSDNIGPDLDNHLRSIKANLRSVGENAQGTTQPEAITGRLWFDTTDTATNRSTLNIHDGVDFAPLFDIETSAHNITSANLALSAIAAGQVDLGLSTFGASLIDDVSAGAARTTLGVPGLSDNNTFSGVNRFTSIQKWSKGADISSTGTLTLGDDGNYFDILGTTAITAIASKGVGTEIKLHFDGALTFTHHATNLVLPGGANITTAAGDEAELVEYASADWRCTDYQRASGGILPAAFATQSEMEAASSLVKAASPGNLNWHPGVAKFHIKCDAAGSFSSEHNVASITDVGTGIVDITLDTDFSTANWCCNISVETSANIQAAVKSANQNAGTVRIEARNQSTAALADPDSYYVSGLGDQA